MSEIIQHLRRGKDGSFRCVVHPEARVVKCGPVKGYRTTFQGITPRNARGTNSNGWQRDVWRQHGTITGRCGAGHICTACRRTCPSCGKEPG